MNYFLWAIIFDREKNWLIKTSDLSSFRNKKQKKIEEFFSLKPNFGEAGSRLEIHDDFRILNLMPNQPRLPCKVANRVTTAPSSNLVVSLAIRQRSKDPNTLPQERSTQKTGLALMHLRWLEDMWEDFLQGWFQWLTSWNEVQQVTDKFDSHSSPRTSIGGKKFLKKITYKEIGKKFVTNLTSLGVVYFEQLLGATRTRKLVEILFFSRFQRFLFISNHFDQLLGERSTRKLVKIHNTWGWFCKLVYAPMPNW